MTESLPLVCPDEFQHGFPEFLFDAADGRMVQSRGAVKQREAVDEADDQQRAALRLAESQFLNRKLREFWAGR